MQHRAPRPLRSVGGIEVAASLLARLSPRTLRGAIDRLRHDARSVLDGLRGVREPSWSSRARPPIAPRPLLEIDPVFELLPRPLKRPYATVRRDLESLARDLRGERRSRGHRRSAPRPMPAPAPSPLAPRRMRIDAKIWETPDAVTLRLAPVDGGASPAFEPGQFLTLELVIEGRTFRRAYSISSSPLDGVIAITCKRIENGKVSTHVVERLREGDVVTVHGPSGGFVPRPATGPRRLVLVAGGSGITPCWSIARTVLAREPDARITLIYGNRSERDVIFGAAIDALAAAEPRLRVVHVLAEPARAGGAIRGVLDAPTFARIAAELHLEREPSEYFVCGPAPMMEAVRAALRARGVPAERIREERFQSPPDPDAARRAARGGAPQLVTVRCRGVEHAITVPPGRTVLEAALASGVSLPFSCAIGGCGACKCRVVSGSVAMDDPNCLSPQERTEGWVLTCVGRPLGPTRLEVP
jgi:ferredoxin-NADP reductase